MKQRAPEKKKIPKALFLSLMLHVVFMIIWGTLQIQLQKKENVPIQVEIISTSLKLSLRALKQPLHFSPVSDLSEAQSQQIVTEDPVLRPSLPRPSLPQISSMTQSNLPTVQQFSMLIEESIPLATASDSVGEIFSLASGPQISRGKIGFGSGASFSKSVARAPRLLGLEVKAPLPEITGLTRPDVALVKVARHLLSTRTNDTMDIVFVIDASKSMRNDIDAARNHLNQMTDLLKAKKLDFTIGLVAFRSGATFSLLGWDFQITPQTTSLRQIKKALNGIRCRGGEKASDALVRAADEVKFRKGAERRFILVTDEYISGSYPVKVVLEKLKAAKIYVDVIGRKERFQKLLAQGTGGLWLPISSLKE